jgi:3,4-dihydroxy 2-butanone 4-phosphate synthase/GTP cyclohydrolase II
MWRSTWCTGAEHMADNSRSPQHAASTLLHHSEWDRADREGGVLVRAGHTEAAIDVARLAGLNPSGVICEIMRDDGSMARLDDLIPFAQRHGLKIGTIRDLIAYRRRHDYLVEKKLEVRFNSRWGGKWTTITYFNMAKPSEQLVLKKGQIGSEKPTLVRMHQPAPLTDLLGEMERARLLERSMENNQSRGRWHRRDPESPVVR